MIIGCWDRSPSMVYRPECRALLLRHRYLRPRRADIDSAPAFFSFPTMTEDSWYRVQLTSLSLFTLSTSTLLLLGAYAIIICMGSRFEAHQPAIIAALTRPTLLSQFALILACNEHIEKIVLMNLRLPHVLQHRGRETSHVEPGRSERPLWWLWEEGEVFSSSDGRPTSEIFYRALCWPFLPQWPALCHWRTHLYLYITNLIGESGGAPR